MKNFTFLSLILISMLTQAQPVLLKDINPSGGSFPTSFTEVNGKILFVANDSIHGGELWVSDGTEAGTSLLKESIPGKSYGGFNLKSGVPFNGKFIFSVDGSEYGPELWISDATESGTHLIKDIRLGKWGSFPGYYYGFNLLNNQLFFQADDSLHGYELWVTDGTESGTKLFMDILPGTVGANPSSMIMCNNKLFFTANDSIYGRELWVSDGTIAGTHIVKDIRPGINDMKDSYGPLDVFKVFNDRVYFIADDGIHGEEIWFSDGTESGTKMLKDINPGAGNAVSFTVNSGSYIVYNNRLYFVATDGTHGLELWSTDGTEAGTVMLKDIYAGATRGVKDFTKGEMIVYKDKLYFSARTEANDFELWSTDGTEAGTALLKNINTNGTNASNPHDFFVFNGKLYFEVDDGINGVEYWLTDGTAAGTKLFSNINTRGSYPDGSSFLSNLTAYNGKLYFLATDTIGKKLEYPFWAGEYESQYKLYVSDGSPNNAVEIVPAGGRNYPSPLSKNESFQVLKSGLYICNGTLYFFARYNSTIGFEPYYLKTAPGWDVAPEVEPTLSIYPNPASNQVHISYSGMITGLSLSDINGRVIYTKDSLNQYSALIPTDNLNNGLYLVRVSSKNSQMVRKLMIQR